MFHHIIIPGKHISYKHLDYGPWSYSTITSINSSQVMVAGYTPPAIHIHQLPSGEIARSIDHRELGLREDDCVHGVNFTRPRLQLAVGEYSMGRHTAKSLRTYKVQHNLSKSSTMLLVECTPCIKFCTMCLSGQ